MTKTKKVLLLCLLCMICIQPLTALADGNAKDGTCPVVRIEPERLPDFNIPRYGYNLLCLNGEPVVVGGHTSGFVLTATAEYLKDGKWHLLQTAYYHDGGFTVALRSGKALIAGGFKDNLGIGQSFEVEMYDPVAHRFTGFGCLDKKRASAGAVELDSGRVLITGNWYADDGMEIYDGEVSFTQVKDVSQSRYLPHVFRISGNDALVVAGYDHHGEPLDTILIDRLRGETFHDPIFDTWRPLKYDLSVQSDDSFIGDKDKGVYAYLMPVKDQSGQLAIIEVRDTVFSLLPTICPVPMQSQWGPITYYTPVYTDRQRQRGYIMGSDRTGRQYALCIDYAKKPAQLTLYHTDELTDTTATTIPVITSEGNLMLTGFKVYSPNSNFSPSASVWLLRFNDEAASASAGSTDYWLWGLGAVFVIMVILTVYYLCRRKRQQTYEQPEEPSLQARGDAVLMQRICELMDGQQLYLQQGLKVSDIASILDTNNRYISECIRAEKGIPFTLFINEYRLEHAKHLLLEYPNKKISTVAIESGFSNDKALTRCFKDLTGLTPTDWKIQSLNPQKQ